MADKLALLGTLSEQEYVNLVAVGELEGLRLAVYEEDLADAQAAIEAFGDQDKINAALGPGTDEKRQRLADAVNLAAAKVSLIASASAGQYAAKAFAAGGDFEPFKNFLGPVTQKLDDIDPDAVRAALNAA